MESLRDGNMDIISPVGGFIFNRLRPTSLTLLLILRYKTHVLKLLWVYQIKICVRFFDSIEIIA